VVSGLKGKRSWGYSWGIEGWIQAGAVAPQFAGQRVAGPMRMKKLEDELGRQKGMEEFQPVASTSKPLSLNVRNVSGM